MFLIPLRAVEHFHQSRRGRMVKQDSIISFADQHRRGAGTSALITKQDSLVQAANPLSSRDAPHVSILKKTDSLGGSSPVRKTIEFVE